MFKGGIEGDSQRKPIKMGGRISGRNERSGGWEDGRSNVVWSRRGAIN